MAAFHLGSLLMPTFSGAPSTVGAHFPPWMLEAEWEASAPSATTPNKGLATLALSVNSQLQRAAPFRR